MRSIFSAVLFMINQSIWRQSLATCGDNNRNMRFISAAVRLVEIYSNSKRKCKVQCWERGRIKDRRTLKFCVAGVREDMFYATRKVRFQPVNEENPGKVPNTIVLSFI